jgi:surfactin synthase thioesterase subunit
MNTVTYHQLSSKRPDRPATTSRVVLFGFAGGSISALLSLAKQFPSWIDVWGAEYPGRGLRWKSKPLDSTRTLLDDLLPGLRVLSDQPIVLLGYSMGANIAYRLALELPGLVQGVIAASSPPPCRRATEWDAKQSSDQVLLDHLISLGGMPPEILSNRTIMETFLPVVRADLSVCADMNSLPSPPLDCPILVIHGASDGLVGKGDAPLWLLASGGEPDHSNIRVYPGGHFFHQGAEQTVAADIARWLGAFSATPPALQRQHVSIDATDHLQ